MAVARALAARTIRLAGIRWGAVVSFPIAPPRPPICRTSTAELAQEPARGWSVIGPPAGCASVEL